MPRSQRIRDKNPTEETLSYPGPDELNEPPEDFDYYIHCLFGTKSIGKTTLTASFPDSLTLMFEPKRKGLKIRQKNLQKYTAKEIMEGAPDTYALVKNTTQQWIDDPSVKYLNYDSIDIFYECVYHSVCASHNVPSPAEAGRSSSDVWNELRDEFSSYFDVLHDTDMGINLLSHVKERTDQTLEGDKMGFAAPSCTPACLQYIRQSTDIILFYGWYNGPEGARRAIMVRDEANSSLVANGVTGKFLQPNGKKLSIFEIPELDDLKKGETLYQTLKDAFDNKLWDIDTPKDERTTTTNKKGPIKTKGPPTKKRKPT